MLRLKETANELAKANGVMWYEYGLRTDDDNVFRVVYDLEVSDKREDD